MKKRRSLKPAGEAKQKPKTRPPTKEERKMGQIVVDFANAETTDEACFKHLEHMQEFMEFSPDFAERAMEAYSSFFQPIPGISLTDPEREFLRLTLDKPDLQGTMRNYHKEMYQYHKEAESPPLKPLFFIKCYKPETSKLTVLPHDYDTDLDEEVVDGYLSAETPSEMPVNEFKDELKKYAGTELPGEYWDYLDEFVEMEKQLSTLKHSISESRLNELEEILEKIWREGEYLGLAIALEAMHGSIKDLQKDLQNILGGIAENKYLNDLIGLGKYIDIYRHIPSKVVSIPPKAVITADILLEFPSISEESYFDITLLHEIWLAHNYNDEEVADEQIGAFLRIQTDLAYCLIRYLKTEGNKNYIYKCDNCKGFYIPKKIYTSDSGLYFCSTPCRMKYHHSKPEYKEKKAAAQREKYGWEKSVNAK